MRVLRPNISYFIALSSFAMTNYFDFPTSRQVAPRLWHADLWPESSLANSKRIHTNMIIHLREVISRSGIQVRRLYLPRSFRDAMKSLGWWDVCSCSLVHYWIRAGALDRLHTHAAYPLSPIWYLTAKLMFSSSFDIWFIRYILLHDVWLWFLLN